MIKYELEKLFLQSSIDKQIRISFDGGVITNTEIPDNSFSCRESLCSEQSLVFGSCESNSIEFTCVNDGNKLIGKQLTVSMILNGQTSKPFNWGKYTVVSEKPSADRLTKVVTAYDAMYDIINANVAEWYNGLTFPITIKNFRDSFFKYLRIFQTDTTLINDNVLIEKTIETEELSGKDVITAICEINGVFGNINRNGYFQYITIETISSGLYPSHTFYPSNSINPRNKISDVYDVKAGTYTALDYEDWSTDPITGLTIATKENDIGVTVGTDKNLYSIVGNFLVYGKETEELQGIASKLLGNLEKVSYAPCNADIFGNPCVEVGDAVSFVTNNGTIVNTYVLERSLTGIQAIYDSISANGTQEYEKALNSTNTKIQQLLGKSNVFERTIYETRSEITALDHKLENDYSTTTEMQSEIRQTASDIELRVSKSYSTKSELEKAIDDVEGNFDNYYTKGETSAAIKVSADSITQAVESNYSTKAELTTNIDGVNQKFADYSTTEEVESKIETSERNITQTVSNNYTTKTDFNDLKSIVDGNISTYEGADEPTLSNYPASDWTTEEDRKRHVGALYIITRDNEEKAGYQYRFSKPSSGWEWTLLSNSDVQKAIKDAQDALAAAGQVADDLSANYTTTTDMNAQITQTADSIRQDVSQTYETKANVTAKIKGVNDNLSANYSTTTQMNSAIDQKGNAITAAVSETYSTKNETKAVKDGVEETLKSYSTTNEMNAAIDLSKTGILSTVSNTYTTKDQTKNAIDGALEEYVTEDVFQSELDQRADRITISVAKSQSKWITGYDSINFSNYGLPPRNPDGSVDDYYQGATYLDVESGILYRCMYVSNKWDWVWVKKYESVQASLELKIEKNGENGIASAIEGTADIIHLNGGRFVVDCDNFTIDGDGVATLTGLVVGENVTMGPNATITWDNVTGTSGVANKSDIPTKTSQLNNDSGLAYESDIPDDDYITNITKNTITTAYVNALNVTAGSVSANNITGTAIRGKTLYTDGKLYIDANPLTMGVEALSGTGNVSSSTLRVGDGFTKIGAKNLSVDSSLTAKSLSVDSTITANSIVTSSTSGFTAYGNISATGNISASGTMSASNNITSSGTVSGKEIVTSTTLSASYRQAYVTQGGTIRPNTGSSRRWKHDITNEIKEELNPERLYDLEVVQYKYNNDHLEEESNLHDIDVVGFIAEDVYENYKHAAAYYTDEDGKVVVDDWNPFFIIPPMLKLIQDQKKQIDALEERLARLEKALS